MAQWWKLFWQTRRGTCVMIAAFVLVANFALSSLHPFRLIRTKAVVPIEEDGFVKKFPAFFHSSQRPDIVVLGSSLPMWAIVYADAAINPKLKLVNFDSVRQYSKAKYLEGLLEHKYGEHLSVANLAVAGSMASDAHLILDRCIKENKTPKVVVFGMGPRDFMDNLVPDIGQSPTFRLFRHSMSVLDLLSYGLRPAQLKENILDMCLYLYEHRTDCQNVLASAISNPSSLLTNIQASNDEQCEGDRCEDSLLHAPYVNDLQAWHNRYNPANFMRLKQETNHFSKLLQLCRDQQIKLIVVNMPLTAENKQQLPAGMLEFYHQQICSLPKLFGATFIDLDTDQRFNHADFCDSAHLNASGGKKAQDSLVAALPNNLNDLFRTEQVQDTTVSVGF
jgi:hypothetical protein